MRTGALALSQENIIMRTLIVLLSCLILSACAGNLPLVGDSEDTTLSSPDESFSLKLPSGWTIKQKPAGVAAGEGGRVSVLAHKDAAATGKGYPTVMVREIMEPTPQGVLDLMAKDKGLEYTELWHVSPEKYQLKQVLLDEKSQVLSYWLVPRDGQGLEYYAAVRLTRFGRLEVIGVAQAGTVPTYMKDFNAIFTSVNLGEKARFSQSIAGETSAFLKRTYLRALARERDALTRQSEETAAWGKAGVGLSPQELGFLGNAYVRAVSAALESCTELSRVVEAHRGSQTVAAMQRLTERLDEAANALDTIQLNIREVQARSSVQKSAVRAHRMAELGREALKLAL